MGSARMASLSWLRPCSPFWRHHEHRYRHRFAVARSGGGGYKAAPTGFRLARAFARRDRLCGGGTVPVERPPGDGSSLLHIGGLPAARVPSEAEDRPGPERHKGESLRALPKPKLSHGIAFTEAFDSVLAAITRRDRLDSAIIELAADPY